MTQFATDIEEQSVSEIVKPPKQYAVILLNDDFTPMDSKITGGTIPAEIFHDIVADE